MTDNRYIELLQRLIATPSQSRHEENTAVLLADFLQSAGCAVSRVHNNVYAVAPGYESGRMTLLLNSHHDTVAPAQGYTRDPYAPSIEGDRLYGLGSNDAGGSVVSLVKSFIEIGADAPCNVVIALTAEEEVGGEHGMRSLLPHLKEQGITIDCAVVGEPTGMQPAVGERGLVVFDCVTRGLSGHAARNEGVNAIYLAMEDIASLRSLSFPVSEVLGPVSISITQINAGRQHNVVPDECKWVIDFRTTDALRNEEVSDYLNNAVSHSELVARSTRVRPSVIDAGHPLVKAAVAMGATPFVSPTTSDMSLLWDIPSLKIGPGQSSRSHSADEYILLSELHSGMDFYSKFLGRFFANISKY